VLELPVDAIPRPSGEEDPALGWTTSRWLGGFGLGIVAIADPRSFSWPGPWIARLRPPGASERRCVVMFGVPSGVVWDPLQGDPGQSASPTATTGPAWSAPTDPAWIEDGFLIAAADIALARPKAPAVPLQTGTLEGIFVSPSAGQPTRSLQRVRALAGRGLQDDRHVTGSGTFPSGLPGSALTLIEAEVCESFDPPLTPDEHRRNLVTRGIGLNALVGVEFAIGQLRCRGMRLCEPCTVAQRYASRPVLRALVHRGGLRVDILEDGEIAVGNELRARSD
jgi:hypothetical protein